MKTNVILDSRMPLSSDRTIPFVIQKNGNHKYLLQHRKRKRDES